MSVLICIAKKVSVRAWTNLACANLFSSDHPQFWIDKPLEKCRSYSFRKKCAVL